MTFDPRSLFPLSFYLGVFVNDALMMKRCPLVQTAVANSFSGVRGHEGATLD